jgi:hypothetical protein
LTLLKKPTQNSISRPFYAGQNEDSATQIIRIPQAAEKSSIFRLTKQS